MEGVRGGNGGVRGEHFSTTTASSWTPGLVQFGCLLGTHGCTFANAIYGLCNGGFPPFSGPLARAGSSCRNCEVVVDGGSFPPLLFPRLGSTDRLVNDRGVEIFKVLQFFMEDSVGEICHMVWIFRVFVYKRKIWKFYGITRGVHKFCASCSLCHFWPTNFETRLFLNNLENVNNK